MSDPLPTGRTTAGWRHWVGFAVSGGSAFITDVTLSKLMHDGLGWPWPVSRFLAISLAMVVGWLAHRLASLHDANDQKVYSSVIVITDRRVLDQQLQDTIYQFDHSQGVVEKIDENSAQLADALKQKGLTPDLVVAPDHRIELAGARPLGEVQRVLLQRLALRFLDAGRLGVVMGTRQRHIDYSLAFRILLHQMRLAGRV